MSESTPFVNTPEILYRLRAANGDLLYVGITRDFPSRLKQHYADKPWANEIRATEQVHIDGTRSQIEAIEKAVIIAEKPRYNKQHNDAERVTLGARARRERSINYVQFPSQDYPWPTGPLTARERKALAVEFGEYGPEWYRWAGVGYEPGWIIEHPEYGEGRVTSCDEDPIHGDVHVAFWGDAVEVRHLSIQWCPLRTVAK